jgi:hypothetical protein
VFTKPPFFPLFVGVLLVPLIIWILVTPPIVFVPCPCREPEAVTSSRRMADTLVHVPSNKRLKLAARVECGTRLSSARRSLSAVR